MTNKIEIFNYEDMPVSFRKESGKIMVNATALAKRFGKYPKDFLKSKEISTYIDRLSVRTNVLTEEIVMIQQGGKPEEQGTWMEQRVAVRFAQWLDPDFAIWVDERILELLNVGFTATEKTVEDLVNDPDLVIQYATKLKQMREEAKRLQQTVEIQTEVIEEQAPKVQFFDTVLQSSSVHTVTTIADELGMTAIALNKFLCDQRIQRHHEGHYVLYAQHQNKGYTKTKTYTHKDADGKDKTRIQTVWTEAGRKFIHDTVKSRMQ